jgi:hypothetical protein
VRPRAVAVLAAVALASAFISPGAHAATSSKTYQPPYKVGPAGGDAYNFTYRDAGTGRMAVARTFPGINPIVGCYPAADAGWATFDVSHRVSRSISSVSLHFDGVLDAYSWVTLTVRAKRRWLGVRKFQGPFGGQDQELTLKLRRTARHGEPVMIEFGVQLGDACPQAGLASVQFPSLTVRS